MGKFTIAILFGIFLIGCDDDESVRVEHVDVERAQANFVKNQPTPTFDFSLERDLMIKLYQARNAGVTTYSYVVSPHTGKVIAGCPSLGFPIPGTTQLTSPQKIASNGSGSHYMAMPQPEPNGLYSPTDTHGTWVMCLGPDGKIEPAYWEMDVLTFSRPMIEQDGRLVAAKDGETSIAIPVGRAHR